MARPYQKDTPGIVIGMHELETLRKRFSDLQYVLGANTDLADAIGEQQAASAKRRIMDTKRDPAGRRWKPWSERYAKTRETQHSLLMSTGALHDSITHQVVDAAQVRVGSNLVYAGVHLFGSSGKQKIPARPYLDTAPGFADSRDRAEIRDVLRYFFKREGLTK
jgi:phage virion morphogenesis protein